MTDNEKKEFEEFLQWKKEKDLKEKKVEGEYDHYNQTKNDENSNKVDNSQEYRKKERSAPNNKKSNISPFTYIFVIGALLIVIIIGFSGNKRDSKKSIEDYLDEVVDSTVVEQDKLESQQNYISQATRDSIYNAMKGDFIIKKDEFSSYGISWVEPKSRPQYRNQNALYCYFAINNNYSVYNMHFVMQYEADSWLFIENCVFNIDGENITYIPSKMERDNNSRIWEWFDERVDNRNISIVRKIANAKSVKIKLNGRQYYDTRTVKANDIASMKKILSFYEALGGTY